MAAVANIFDRDGDGFIDYKEFVAALRPEREVSSLVGSAQFCSFPWFVSLLSSFGTLSCIQIWFWIAVMQLMLVCKIWLYQIIFVFHLTIFRSCVMMLWNGWVLCRWSSVRLFFRSSHGFCYSIITGSIYTVPWPGNRVKDQFFLLLLFQRADCFETWYGATGK